MPAVTVDPSTNGEGGAALAVVTISIASLGGVNCSVIELADLLCAAYTKYKAKGGARGIPSKLCRRFTVGSANYVATWTPFTPLLFTGLGSSALECGELTIMTTSGAAPARLCGYMIPYTQIAAPTNWATITAVNTGG